MILQESYNLSGLCLKYNKRELNLLFMYKEIYVSYSYNNKQVGETKSITLKRLWKFMNKYRGFKTKRYNRPCMDFKTFDTKTNKRIT